VEYDASERMATMSVWVGITSILFFNTIFLSLILAGTAVTLAILSRGSSSKFSKPAKIGLFIGIVALILTYFILVDGIYIISQNENVRNAIMEFINTGNADSLNEIANYFS